MICASNDEDAVIALQSVHFVQEITPDTVVDDRIQILEHEIARRKLASLSKDLLD